MMSDPESSFSLALVSTPQGPTNLRVQQAFSSSDMLTGLFHTPCSTWEQQPTAPLMEPIAAEWIQLKEKEEESVVLGYLEEDCIKVYQSHSSLQWHLDAAIHLLAIKQESTNDAIKKKWAETCKSISSSYMDAAHKSTSASTSVSHGQSGDEPLTANMGWALKWTEKSVHFTTKVRQFLRAVFLQGESTGNKATAEDVAARMRSMRTTQGTKVFTKDEWLIYTQISRYFSRLATLNRSEALHRTEEARPTPTEPVPERGESEDEEGDPYIAEAPIINGYPAYMKQMFSLRSVSYSLRGSNILSLPKPSTTSYGLNLFCYLASKLWNSLPENYRTVSSYQDFEQLIRNYNFYA